MNRFLAGDDPAVAIADRPGFQARGVGSGAGFGQRERRDDVAGRDAVQPACLLLVGAEADQHLPGDAVVGAEHRPHRQRVAQFHCQFNILDQIQPKTTPLLGDRVAEQPHLLGVPSDVVENPILGQDLGLAGNDDGADELTCLAQDLGEIVIADFGADSCGGHERISLPTAPGEFQISYIKYDLRDRGGRPGR